MMISLNRAAAVSGIALCVMTTGLRADCSSQQANSAGYTNHAILGTTSLPSAYHDELTAAQNAWNSTSCNSGSHESGHSFPMFSTSGFGTTFEVVFVSGTNPSNPYSCGNTNFATDTITLYGSAKKPSGGSYNCTQTNILVDTMTHELGHLLGLADQGGGSCSSVAMSQVGFTSAGAYVDRSVKSEECQEADAKTKTPSELRAEACEGDADLAICKPPDPNTCAPCGC